MCYAVHSAVPPTVLCRGRSAEYYNKCYGPYLASTVRRVRDELFNKGGMHETAV